MTKRAELLTVGLGRIMNACLALVTLYAVTRLLPPAGYALIVLFGAMASFAGLILINPAGQWLNRHLHEWHEAGALANRLDSLLRYVLCVGALVGLLGGLWFLLIHDADAMAALQAGGVVAANIFFLTAAQTYSSALNSLGHRISAVLWQLGMTGLGLAFAIAMTLARADAFMWLAGQALGAAAAFIGARRALLRVMQPKKEGQERQHNFVRTREFLFFAIPLAGVTSLMWLEGNGYRFLMERAWSPHVLGIFFMALSIPAQMTAVMESVVMQFAYPYFFRAISGESNEELRGQVTQAMTNTLLPLYWLWGAFLCLAAPQVVFLVTGHAYHAAAEWIIFGVLLEVARLTGNAWLLTSQANKDFRPMVVPFAVGGAGSLAAGLLVWAIDGSATTLAIGLVTAALVKNLLVVLRAQRLLPLRLSPKRLFLSGAVLLLALLAYAPLSENRGSLSALAIVGGAGALTAALAYVHLKTVHYFHALLRQRLG